MTFTKGILFFCFAIAVGVFGLYITHKSKTLQVVQAPVGSVDAQDAQGASYKIEGREISLVNGIAELPVEGSSATSTTRYFGNEAVGDLNGDGKEDVALILTQSSGGSGTFYYVAVALRTDTGYRGTNALLLGDRIAPQTTEIKDAVVVANYAIRAEGDPMTTKPSIGVSLYAKIMNGVLVQTSAQ